MKKRMKFLTVLVLATTILGCKNLPALKSNELSEVKNFNINDEFDNNKYKWYEEKNKEIEVKVANGYYNIDHKDEDSSFQIYKKFDFKDDKTYLGETSIRYEKGNTDEGFGIYFGLSNKRQAYFEIDNLGEVTIFEDEGDKTSTILDWTKTEAVNINDWNIFEFIMGKGEIQVYLNNYKIGTINLKLNKTKLTEVGYDVNGKLKVNIDYMRGKSIKN
ncbi:hypothetical protein [Haliovirga abyssi]|uniref:DUF1080 domain-containing protein n=1 Tax=Haliovirga abyssi TaxID=2996794 RepID=A0AAU9E5A3_9FUSO|nr:hypothetical protein [Haliovirga abyssi]BDU51720.1 hypothetical protein HLVA_22890 [Haliovirga abyssi]